MSFVWALGMCCHCVHCRKSVVSCNDVTMYTLQGGGEVHTTGIHCRHIFMHIVLFEDTHTFVTCI